MNIYVVAKKSFFSKLFLFAMVAVLSLSSLVPTFALAVVNLNDPTMRLTPPTGTPPAAGWKVVPTETYVDRVKGAIITDTTTEKMSFLRTPGTHGFYSENFDGDGLEEGYVSIEMAKVLQRETGSSWNPKGIYAVATQVDGQDVTNYYVGQILIASARPTGLYIPPRGGLQKLGDRADDGSTDLDTEAGLNNFLDQREGRRAGATNTAIRGSDQGNITNLQNRQTDLEKQLEDLDKQIAAETDPAKKAALSAKRDALQATANDNQALLQSARTTGPSRVNTTGCTDHWYSVISIDCMTALIAVLANMYLKLVSFALGAVGSLFDYSIEIAINSAEFIDRIGVVNPIWSFIRDLLNMTFIFILLWIAVNIILGRKGYSLRSNVVKVVIVAILINFSLFAAKALVDGSNLLTLQLYQASKGNNIASSSPSISSHIMNTLGMPTIYKFSDIGTTDTIQGCGDANGTIITVAIFGSIFMIILGIAFLLAAVLFFSRMANIVYLFIISPLWVWGYIMDTSFFKRRRDDWWNKMVQVIKFPVVYMLFIFVGVFAFTKLIGLRNSQNLSFLTLFCVSQDKSLIGQLPLIMNFCLVTWVMLQAVRYGVKNGAGPEGSSLGFTRSFNEKWSKKFGGWAENAWKRPISASRTALAGGAKSTVRSLATAGAYLPNKIASRVARSASTPNVLRDLAARIAQKTKDPKIYGKTRKEDIASFKKMLVGNETERTNRILDVAMQSVGDAPKYDPTEDNKEDMEKKVADYARKTASVFFKPGVLKDNGNLEAIIAAARAGVTAEKDSEGNITGYSFKQANMREKIAEIRRDYMPGNKKGNRTHNPIVDKFGLLQRARIEARNKAVNARADGMVSNDGKAQTKQDDSPDAIKERIKKAEDDIKKYPISLEQLNIWIGSGDESKLKGIGEANKIKAKLKDMEEKEAYLKELEKVGSSSDIPFDEFGEVTRDHVAIQKTKAAIDKNKAEIEKMKKAILTARGNIQKKIMNENKKLEKKDDTKK
ncbi:MAG: hypothetical protein RJB39_692 [Candidatus Parcubacteria bacterium]|jgi:hypothetical protein